MWVHFCEGERALIWVGSGETCNWCDVPEFSCVDVSSAEADED